MDHLVIENLRPYDGRYEMDLSHFSTREYGWMRRLAGRSPRDVADALFQVIDPELWSVVAVIVLRRAGRIENAAVERLYERLLDETFTDVIRVEWGVETAADEGDDAVDPTGSSTEKPTSSGPDSSRNSERSTTDTPSDSGTPVSVISGSAPSRSGS